MLSALLWPGWPLQRAPVDRVPANWSPIFTVTLAALPVHGQAPIPLRLVMKTYYQAGQKSYNRQDMKMSRHFLSHHPSTTPPALPCRRGLPNRGISISPSLHAHLCSRRATHAPCSRTQLATESILMQLKTTTMRHSSSQPRNSHPDSHPSPHPGRSPHSTPSAVRSPLDVSSPAAPELRCI